MFWGTFGSPFTDCQGKLAQVKIKSSPDQQMPDRWIFHARIELWFNTTRKMPAAGKIRPKPIQVLTSAKGIELI